MTASGGGPAAWEAGLSSATLVGLEQFAALVARYDCAVDLVGPGPRGASLRDLIGAALEALPHLPERGRVLDVGSGNGVPIVPLLLARPELEAVLLEPRERRWAFLKEAARELGLPVTVLRERVEEHAAAPYDALTVQALSPSTWGAAAGRLVCPGGVAVWWCSERASPPALRDFGPVVTSPLPLPGRGRIAVWRRCFT